MGITHHYQQLIDLFNGCFEEEYNTRLVKGGDEPMYCPADNTRSYHAIFFAHGFFSSALHECAHWFIAGPARRLQEDFGYWYQPDGRTAEQQQIFQTLEVKPQAIEWILSDAAQYKFQISIDNLNGESFDTHGFKQAVYQQVLEYRQKGLPKRAEQFRKVVTEYYQSCSLDAAQA